MCTTGILPKDLRSVIVVNFALLLLVASITSLHMFAHFCPLHMRGCESKQVTRVVYGMAMPGMRGPNRVAGGCVIGPVDVQHLATWQSTHTVKPAFVHPCHRPAERIRV